MILSSLISPSFTVPNPSADSTEPYESLCTCSVWCFFLSWESACDQQRANQQCPDRGQGFCILLEQK
ncbi:unnamed protein product [Staurois parvus]|uniref:Uncharacterized protein n=1 Tax=Staurois parvus TaxID=386267 RepID=A0ABN9EUE7_9NEOB|nr:unnamed protein product [Staurois parvus]